jgi:hypothetical protein
MTKQADAHRADQTISRTEEAERVRADLDRRTARGQDTSEQEAHLKTITG